jgi:predicted nucleotidyltransferase component of viral defense system
MFSLKHDQQARLLVQCIPEVEKQNCFALKGGTAINLFLRELPRMSVDIDLTYLPLKDRDESLAEIDDALVQIGSDIEKGISGATVRKHQIQGHNVKLFVVREGLEIKIEPNLILRGSVGEPTQREMSTGARDHFGASARMLTLSAEDLYGGKLCAALDRQHPRDLFDVMSLLAEGGITPAVRRAFVVYLASHSRPMHELLNPNLLDISDAFDQQFAGMARDSVSLDELLNARKELIGMIPHCLDAEERRFLVSMKSGEPEWESLGIEHLERLPALQWKLLNIQRMDARKRDKQLAELRDLLEV